MTGADLTKLPGLELLAVQRILSEIGLDMSRWPSEKHFCAWLNVAPNNRISGGKILSSKPRKNANRAAAALRLAPKAPCKVKLPSAPSSDALSRVLEHRPLSTPEHINWLVCSIACLSLARLTSKPDSKPMKSSSKKRTLRNLQRRARELGFDVTPIASTALVS